MYMFIGYICHITKILETTYSGSQLDISYWYPSDVDGHSILRANTGATKIGTHLFSPVI